MSSIKESIKSELKGVGGNRKFMSENKPSLQGNSTLKNTDMHTSPELTSALGCGRRKSRSKEIKKSTS